MADKHSINETDIENLLGNEVLEDMGQNTMMDEIDNYLDSEAHILVEQEMLHAYEMEHGSNEGYTDMLADRLGDAIHEESSDIAMYNRIQDKINSVPSLAARKRLYEKFAPEILKGRERSTRLVARAQRKLDKLRAIESRRSVRVSLKPNQRDNREREHPGRVKERNDSPPLS